MSEGHKRQGRDGGFIAGAMIGGAIGFVAGTILAPKSGDETRSLFSEHSQELRDKVEEFLASARERMFAVSNRKGGRYTYEDFPFDDIDLDENDL